MSIGSQTGRNILSKKIPGWFIMGSVTYFTPTLCKLMKIIRPNISSANPSKQVIKYFKDKTNGKKISKVIIYAADAIGKMILNKYPEQETIIKQISPLQLNLKAEFPSYTPVNYASIFTGAKPEIHGITSYTKPILKCETLFDALPDQGKRTALVAVEECSNSIIFQNRDIDYFIKKEDEEIEDTAVEIIKSKKYDLILVDRQDYDRMLHKTTPYSNEAILAFGNIIDSFHKLGNLFLEYNKEYNVAIIFISDHGAHINCLTKKGEHGTDQYDDIMLRHFWGIYPNIV
jgi:hypothetical protein